MKCIFILVIWKLLQTTTVFLLFPQFDPFFWLLADSWSLCNIIFLMKWYTTLLCVRQKNELNIAESCSLNLTFYFTAFILIQWNIVNYICLWGDAIRAFLLSPSRFRPIEHLKWCMDTIQIYMLHTPYCYLIYFSVLLIISCYSRMLVYEYVNNGNLEQWLHGAMRQHGVLTWEARMKVVLGIAKA